MNIIYPILAIFLYVFVLALIILIVGTVLERMELAKKGYSGRTINIILIVATATFYIAILFLFLNDWAARMLR